MLNILIRLKNILIYVALGLLSAFTPIDPHKPELATGKTAKPLVTGKSSMIVTNNPWSSKAAQRILQQGGNAVDAAITAAFVLGLTEPQSSGIGGGGYALTYVNKKLMSYDGREVAPASATPELFLDETGKPLSFQNAVLSPLSIGVPGEVALLYKMHIMQGKLPWKQLLQPAIELAEQGFPMSPRLHDLLVDEQDLLDKDLAISRVFFEPNLNYLNCQKNTLISNIQSLMRNKDCFRCYLHDLLQGSFLANTCKSFTVKPIGSKVVAKELASTLRAIAKNPNNFYRGKIAEDIVATINAKAKKAIFNLKDLSNYRVKITQPICSKYRENFLICSVPPSSSGGITLQELLGIYTTNYRGNHYDDNQWIFHFFEASKLAFADRNQYLADPAFVQQPIEGLLDSSYIQQRARLVGKTASATPVAAGKPKGIDSRYAPDNSPKLPGTTSIVVVDKDGNAVSMTVTIEHQFGSHLSVDGFFLNNELTDFSLAPKNAHGKLIANRVEAGKRPRSSMAPTMIFNSAGQLYALLGSPGGSQIICYLAKNIILMLDMNMTPDKAVASPNLCAVNTRPEVEKKTSFVARIPSLNKLGEHVTTGDLVSGETNIIQNPHGGWLGAADTRREGLAIGH